MNSENKYRVIYEHYSEGIVVIQNDYIVFLNPKLMQITGFTWKELTQWPAVKFIYPEDREHIINDCKAIDINDEKTYSFTFRISTKDKKIKRVEIKVSNIEWEGESAHLIFVKEADK